MTQHFVRAGSLQKGQVFVSPEGVAVTVAAAVRDKGVITVTYRKSPGYDQLERKRFLFDELVARVTA